MIDFLRIHNNCFQEQKRRPIKDHEKLVYRLIKIQLSQMVSVYSWKFFIFSHHLIKIMQFLRITQLSMQIQSV